MIRNLLSLQLREVRQHPKHDVPDQLIIRIKVLLRVALEVDPQTVELLEIKYCLLHLPLSVYFRTDVHSTLICTI